MFEGLQDQLSTTLRKLRGQSQLTEKNIEEASQAIRRSLLEADVHFKVVKNFIERIKEQSLGQEVLKSISAGQQFTKIVYDELKRTLGGEAVFIDVKKYPSFLFLVGLQGAGKTTTAAKLALHLRKKMSKTVGLLPLDVYRPAAIEQLKVLGQSLGVPVFETKATDSPIALKDRVQKWIESNYIDVVIVDTAGRLQIDEVLMGELSELKAQYNPREILLVADAMLGSQAVNVSREFNERLGLTGLILTKMDGDARGGAALSVRETTGVPIKFLGTGEKPSEFEVFYPERLAGRILDMGDVVSLVERAEELISKEDALKAAQKMQKKQFTVEDFLSQLRMLKKLGGLQGVMGFLPGMGAIKDQLNSMAPPDDELKKIEAIICSMTIKERRNHKILDGSRRLRIAKGSGLRVQDVNRFVQQFEQSQKLMSQMMSGGLKGMKLPKVPKSPFR